MPNYKIVGAADCPYFARAERIGHILACTFPALHHGIQIEMKSPSAWTSYFTQMCRELGYTPYKAGGSIKSSSYTLAQAAGGFDPADLDPSSHEGRVLVWDPITRRVIGGESAFKQEAYQKYGVRCDISWGRCLAIAQENAQLFATKQSHHAMRPLNIIIAGRPMSGKRTQIPRLVEKFNLVHINCGTVIAQAAKRDTESGRFIADYFKKRLAMLTSTPKVESESEALLVPPSKSVPELGFAKGEHLEDPLAVHKEQVALSWEEDCNILRAAEAQIPLLPDSLVIPLVLSALQAPEVKERGFLLEGFPRTPAQAQALVNADIPIDAVILLDIDQQTALERQRARLIDPVLNLAYSSASTDKTDDSKEEEEVLARRADDAEDALAVRLRHFELSVIPALTQFYSDKTTVVNANTTPDELTKRLVECLSALRM